MKLQPPLTLYPALLNIRRITLDLALITEPRAIVLTSLRAGIPKDHPFSPHPGRSRPAFAGPYIPWRDCPEGVSAWEWAEICRMRPPDQ